jgi:hypothetical protein
MLKEEKIIISFAEGDEQRMMLMGLRRFFEVYQYVNIVEETITKKLVN